MSNPVQTRTQSSEHNDARDRAPAVVEASDGRVDGLAPWGTTLERGSADVVLLVLIGAPAVVALVLLLVILPILDGRKAQDSAGETYSEMHSMSYTAGWETDGEIRSVQASLHSDLSSLDSGLWSVGFDLGSLAYDVEAESRPRVRELEDAVDARRAELRQIRHSADARFDELRDSVEARLSGFEDAADAALDDHWGESSRQFSRDTRIILGALGFMVVVGLVFGSAGLWLNWRDSRALARQAEGM